MDVLSVILSDVEPERLNSQQRQAVKDFKKMVEDIEAIKKEKQIVTSKQAEELLTELKALKQQNLEEYSQIVNMLKTKLQEESESH
jgi:NADH:ubiquinone oxidoreductase subunit C